MGYKEGWCCDVVNYIAEKSAVEGFLKDMNMILDDENFNIKTDLDILLSDKDKSEDDPHTTKNTLLDLDYGVKDIEYDLARLDVTEYLHCVVDNKPGQSRPFYAFIKKLKDRDVYIKVKLREGKKIFCVSFHYDDFEGCIKVFPYR